MSRDVVLSEVWPDAADAALAGQSLNSLTHSLHKQLGDALSGSPPVLHVQGSYQLNLEAGVGVDTASFEALATAGDSAIQSIEFWARVAELPGCFTSGDTIAEVEQNVLDAIEAYLDPSCGSSSR